MAPGQRGLSLLAWIIAFTVLCTFTLGLRLWSAIVAKRKFFADDAMVLFAFANTLALEGVAIWAIWHNLGEHAPIPMEDYEVQFKLILAADVCWLLGTVFIKFSILWLYARIFAIPDFRRWSQILIGIVAAYGIAFFILFMSRCVPVEYQWSLEPGHHCRDIYIDQVTSVSLNIVIDLAIIILPMPYLWTLKLAMRSKVAITIMFSIGLVTISIMIWRLYFTVNSRNDPDFVYNLYYVGLISFMELWLGVIVACIPTLAPLAKRYIRPTVSKLTQRTWLPGSGSKNSGPSSFPDQGLKKPSPYDRLEESPTNSSVTHEENFEMAPNSVVTDCRYDPERAMPPPPAHLNNTIYVHHKTVQREYSPA